MAKLKNKVKAVIFSDHHLENWKRFNDKERRTKYGLEILLRIKKITLRHKCISLFAGDILHKEKGISNKLLSLVLPLFSKLWSSGKFKTYAISGNHDQSEQNLIDKQSPSYINTLAKTFKGLISVDFKQEDFGDWTLSGVPYLTHDIGLVDYIKGIKLESKKFNVLMLHTTMPGAKDTDNREIPSHLDLNKFEKAVSRFDLVICGHIHKPEDYWIGKTKIIQVGAPNQQRLTDRDCEMGYWIMYDNFEVEFINFKKYPKFKIIAEGESKPDNHNYYVVEKKPKVNKDPTNIKAFDNNLSVSKLSRNYLKEKGIKDKKRKRALINILKDKTR